MLIRQSLRYSTDLIFTFEYTEITKECRCRIGDIIKVQYNLNGVPTVITGTIVETIVTKLDTTKGYMKLSKLDSESNATVIRVIPFRDIINIDIIQSVFGTIINYIEDNNKKDIENINNIDGKDKIEFPSMIEDEDGEIKPPTITIEEDNKHEGHQSSDTTQESTNSIIDESDNDISASGSDHSSQDTAHGDNIRKEEDSPQLSGGASVINGTSESKLEESVGGVNDSSVSESEHDKAREDTPSTNTTEPERRESEDGGASESVGTDESSSSMV